MNKTMNKTIRFFATVLIFTAAPICADELSAIIGGCNGCHGDDGVSQWTDIPTISGIDAFTHSDALFVYRDEARPCQMSCYKQGDTDRAETNMCFVVADLNDEQIEQIADHYAALPFVPAKQDFDADLAATGKDIHSRECSKCHSDGGSVADDEAGILAGQWMGYLEASFADYASGERDQPEKMQEKMANLSDADVKALLHYYASQQ